MQKESPIELAVCLSNRIIRRCLLQWLHGPFSRGLLFIINRLEATLNPWVKTKGSRVRMLGYPAEGERLRHL
jgi:hypothetical protein